MMNSGSYDMDALRYDRENRTQPAAFAPGQDAVFQNNDIFSAPTMPNDGGAMNDIFSTGIGAGSPDPLAGLLTPNVGMGGMPMGNSMMQPQAQQPQMPRDQADMFWDAMGKGFKGTQGFFKDLIASVGTFTPRWWSEWGRTVLMTGGVVAGVGLVAALFGVGFGSQLAIGGLLSAAGGTLIWLFKTDEAKNYTSKYKDTNNTNQSFNPPVAEQPPMATGFDMMSGGLDNFTPLPSASSFDDDDPFASFASDDDDYILDDDDDDDYYVEPSAPEPVAGMGTEEAFDSLRDVPNGMYERRYLWDMFLKVLPTMRPNFAEMKLIDEDEESFLIWENKLREAAEAAGCKEDYLPELLRLQENLFTIIVTCSRPTGFKPDNVANELANIYAYSSETGIKNENVFAKVDTIGRECRITIFNGASAMISLKDMMLQEESWIMNTDNYMPVILGVDQLGNLIKADFQKLESVIITGMPRSGKSWFVQAVLTQMCVFVSPRELNIYICDPKEGISDFKAFTLPHVKKFVSGDANIVQTLRNLVKNEAPRRKRIIGDAGHVNIWDYKKRYPDVKLPIIYVVIDEVVTLAERMEKEVKQEFQALLVELISQLPALGIRAFLIPHVIKNDIIAKTATDLVPCKISICGDADHIEKATGSKYRDFPYKLVNKGDMAVKLTGFQNTLYVHGPALTSSNELNGDIFDYLRRVWGRLEPSEVEDSIAVGADVARENAQALAQVNNDSYDEPIQFSEPNQQGISGMTNVESMEDLNLF